jgi:hypothetical protein
MAQTRVGVRQRPTSNIVTDGLVLHLDAGNTSSYPGTGIDWYDLTNNDNDGTLLNGASYVTDGGGSISFDGVNDYVNYGDVMNKDGSTPFSVGVTFNADTLGLVGLISKYKWNSWNGFIVCIISNKIYFLIGNGSNNAILVRGSTTITTGVYYNIVVTYDGSTNASGVNIYVNGVLESMVTSVDNFTGGLSNTDNLTVGAFSDPTGYFNGNIYSSQIYNRALTESEIQQNYNTTKGRFGL